MDAAAPDSATAEKVSAFIERWRPGGGSERSNYQLFLTEQFKWPKELRTQVALIRRLSAQTAPTVEAITPMLKGRNTAKRKEQIAAILETLESLGWR